MKQIKDYNEVDVRKAYEGITTALVINASQPITVDFLLKSLEELKVRAKELNITLK